MWQRKTTSLGLALATSVGAGVYLTSAAEMLSYNGRFYNQKEKFNLYGWSVLKNIFWHFLLIAELKNCSYFPASETKWRKKINAEDWSVFFKTDLIR